MADHPTTRAAALAVLASPEAKTRKAGAFLGQCVVDATPLTAAQAKWFDQLLERAGMPTLHDGGNSDGGADA